MTSLGKSPDVSEGRPQDFGRKRPLELPIRPNEDGCIKSVGDFFKTSVGDVPWCYI